MKKIDWTQTIAIIANVGVLLGIVFLAIEIRDSRIAILAQTQDSVADGFLALNLATITEPEIGITFQKGLCAPEELTDLEAIRFSMQMRALFNQFRRIYRLYEQGLLDDGAWRLYGTEAEQFMTSPGGKWHFSVNELETDLRMAIDGFSKRQSNVNLQPGRDSQELCGPQNNRFWPDAVLDETIFLASRLTCIRRSAVSHGCLGRERRLKLGLQSVR